MAHCPYTELDDLKPLLEQVRGLEKLKETKPGIFYLKGQGFLHFHINKERERWIDVRDGKRWGSPIPTPFEMTSAAQKKALKEIQHRYERTLKTLC